jgi:hypothetical protein
VTPAEWVGQPAPLPELSLDAAAAIMAGRWVAAASLLDRGASLARRIAHPSAAEWEAAVGAVAACRAAPSHAGVEVVRAALVALCGGRGDLEAVEGAGARSVAGDTPTRTDPPSVAPEGPRRARGGVLVPHPGPHPLEEDRGPYLPPSSPPAGGLALARAEAEKPANPRDP